MPRRCCATSATRLQTSRRPRCPARMSLRTTTLVAAVPTTCTTTERLWMVGFVHFRAAASYFLNVCLIQMLYTVEIFIHKLIWSVTFMITFPISDMADYQKMDVDAPGAEMVDDLQLGAAADVLGMRSVFRARIPPGFSIFQ